jgi:hypothetical protein
MNDESGDVRDQPMSEGSVRSSGMMVTDKIDKGQHGQRDEQ